VREKADGRESQEVRIDLSKFDPLTIKERELRNKYTYMTDAWGFTVESSTPGAIGYTWKETTPTSNAKPVTLTLDSEDKETAQRLSRAFKHAIKLCGGKVEPF
jgi:hypothetical protein